MRDKNTKISRRGKTGRRRKKNEAKKTVKVESRLRNSSLKTGRKMKTNGPVRCVEDGGPQGGGRGNGWVGPYRQPRSIGGGEISPQDLGAHLWVHTDEPPAIEESK